MDERELPKQPLWRSVLANGVAAIGIGLVEAGGFCLMLADWMSREQPVALLERWERSL